MKVSFWGIIERYGELFAMVCFAPFLLLGAMRSLTNENWLAAVALTIILGVVLFELPASWRKAKERWQEREEMRFRESIRPLGFYSGLIVLGVLSIPLYALWLTISALFQFQP